MLTVVGANIGHRHAVIIIFIYRRAAEEIVKTSAIVTVMTDDDIGDRPKHPRTKTSTDKNIHGQKLIGPVPD